MAAGAWVEAISAEVLAADTSAAPWVAGTSAAVTLVQGASPVDSSTAGSGVLAAWACPSDTMTATLMTNAGRSIVSI